MQICFLFHLPEESDLSSVKQKSTLYQLLKIPVATYSFRVQFQMPASYKLQREKCLFGCVCTIRNT